MKTLKGRVALVAGATRGAGRGIATMLGEAGATVYCTGRSTRAKRRPRKKGAPFDLERRPETIEETAELVSAAGGTGVAVRVDHSQPKQVAALIKRIERDHGRLDVLVNDIWGGEALLEHKPMWECAPERGLALVERAVFTHIITSRYAIPLMLATRRRRGLIVEITDGDGAYYRGSFYYDFVKLAVIRMAFALAEELRPHRIAAVAVSPGFLRSEAMLDFFGVTEERWKDGVKTDPHFLQSETPWYVGRAVAALARDDRVMEKSGRALSSWTLMREYGFTDRDGRQPDWGRYFEAAATPDLAKFRDDFRASADRYLSAFAR